VVPLTISKSPLPGGLSRLKIDVDGVATNFSRNCSVPKYKISTNLDMSNAKEFNTILNSNGELYTLPYKQKVQIAIPYGIAPRYVQLVTYNGTNVEHSNVLSFTPRAFNPNAVPWSSAMCNYTSSNMAKIYFLSRDVALCGW
jgi:hypothetical protein